MADAKRQFQGKTYGSIDRSDYLENGIKKESPHTVDAIESADLSYSSPTQSEHSVHDMHRSVAIPGEDQSWLSKMFAFAGPGALVAVGYMDPGNWTTAIGGGSAYNYDLLFVVLWSSLIALFFQILSVRLAIATEKDLAQACKQYYPPNVNMVLWLAAEVAIIATDLAEVLGSAIAMQLLFGWRLEIGVLVTAGDVLLVFLTQVRM
jgi:manganese transport protein